MKGRATFHPGRRGGSEKRYLGMDCQSAKVITVQIAHLPFKDSLLPRHMSWWVELHRALIFWLRQHLLLIIEFVPSSFFFDTTDNS